MPSNKGNCIEATEVARRIGVSLDQWPGNCMAIATACVKHGVVKGRVVYGMWHGPIDRRSRFAGRSFTHHAWVAVDAKTVFDPTRWCFDRPAAPYIWQGVPGEEYDEGGGRLTMAYRSPLPPSPMGRKLCMALPPELAAYVERETQSPCSAMPMSRLGWLLKVPPQMLPEPGALYAEVKRLKMEALVPIDYRRAVEAGCAGRVPDEDVDRCDICHKPATDRDMLFTCDKCGRQFCSDHFLHDYCVRCGEPEE